MPRLFISHSSQDDAFVRELRRTLADLQQEAWIDSRELRGGDLLWPEIEEASAFAVVVSPDALQSTWVGRELSHALKLRKKRGNDKYPVIPLSLNGTKLGVLEALFGQSPERGFRVVHVLANVATTDTACQVLWGQVRGSGGGRGLESRDVRGGEDPHRAATGRRAPARGI